MPKTVLAALHCGPELQEAIQAPLAGLAAVDYLQDLEPAQRRDALAGADVVMTYRFFQELQPGEPALLKAGGLLQSVTAGVETLPYAELDPGLKVCSNSGAWAAPLAEWALGMAIALGKRFAAQSASLARGEWGRPPTYLMRGRTLGIIGYGGIGREVARVFAPLGMGLMALNRSGRGGEELDFIGTLADLDRLLSQADVVVISTPLNRETRGLIGAAQLALMKPDAILLNLARGPIVDQEALYRHLVSHPDFRFGADVWWEEPGAGAGFRLEHPFFELPNVLGTPHNADHVEGSLVYAAGQAARNAARFLAGGRIAGEVNRKDYA